MTRATLLPRAAAALLLGVAAAACTDDASPPDRPPAPTRTATSASTPTPAPEKATGTPVPAAPGVLTQEDAGRTFALRRGGTTRLHLSGRWREAAPAVDGTAIVLVPVEYETDPGFRAWDVRAAGQGEAVLRTTDRPGLRPLTITFRVG
ncbi:hypothetical protein ABZ946_31315 [Streptomyces sp. NPDC046324]|uniref:hypothetical protein n=1 Tax=Streptomyces sp. NPDC046324 TaxID=3154915 RepID=UPI0033E81122